MSDGSELALEVKNLSKEYAVGEGTLRVLDDITFSLPSGSTCAIVGPSGSGKSTLMALCAGLSTASSGTIQLLGRSLNDLNEDERAQLRQSSIGFVFQAFQLIPTLTARENVMVPLELQGRGDVDAVAVSLLERVGLGARLGHYPAQLSGGEQQRVALARAFVHQPAILFADEPTGNLDADTSDQICELLFELNRETGATLIMVTHDNELAASAQIQLRLRGGRLAELVTS